MEDNFDFVNSETFWTAVGSIAAVIAAVAALISKKRPRNGKDKDLISPEDRARIENQAQEAVCEFDRWMKKYSHPKGLSDAKNLLRWLSAASGYKEVAGQYHVFAAVAKKAAVKGYKTLPVPTEAEFDAEVEDAKRRKLRL